MAAGMDCGTVRGRFQDGEFASVVQERKEALLDTASSPTPTAAHLDHCQECQIAFGQEIQRRLDEHPLLARAAMGIAVAGVEDFLRSGRDKSQE